MEKKPKSPKKGKQYLTIHQVVEIKKLWPRVQYEMFIFGVAIIEIPPRRAE